MKKLLIYFGGNYKLGYFGGHFYTFKGFFKTKVQNGNVFGGSQNFKVFFFFGGGGGEGGAGMPDIPIFRVGGKQWMHEEKLRVAPINDTFSVLSF